VRILITAITALFVAGAAYAQAPMTNDSVKNAPKDSRASKDRDSMPKPDPNVAQQGSGAMQEEAPKKK